MPSSHLREGRGRGSPRAVSYALLAALLLLFTVLSSSALAATGSLYASRITSPGGQVWMGTHLWVSDHLQGFCRVDNGAINQATCDTSAASPGQPSFDPATNSVYIPDNSATGGGGVWRLSFDPATETVGTPVRLASLENAGVSTRPTATALGPDGKLYVGSIKNGEIKRIANPSGQPAVEAFGQTSDGRGVSGLAFVGGDLYLAEGGGVTRIAAGAASNTAQPVAGVGAVAPMGVASDGSNILYVADLADEATGASNVLRYKIDTGTREILANRGTLADGTSALFKFAGALALNAGTLYIGDDPADGAQVLRGHVWSVADAATAAPEPDVPVPGLTSGKLYASEITSPGGQVWMGGNLWVSDHVMGFCRIDRQADGSFAVNQDTCADTTKIVSPGQPTYQPSKGFVYVPDNSSRSRGVWRMKFNATSKTVGAPQLMAPGKGLAGLRTTSTALGPDGKLYVGSIKSALVKRITNPGGAISLQKVENVGRTSDGRGPLGLTFAGPDPDGAGPLRAGSHLYLAEGAAVTRIANAAKCSAAACTARATPIKVLAPLAITSNGKETVYVADLADEFSGNTNVLRYNISTQKLDVYANSGTLPDGTSVAFKFVSGLSLNPAGNLFVGDDPSDGVQVLGGHVWMVRPPA